MVALDNAALEGSEASQPFRRIGAIDVGRGIAVIGMAIFHTAWDLSALSLADLDVTESFGWALFARAIAGSFLVLSGIGLVLAHRGGIRRRAFLRRLAVIAAAALAVTVATLVVFPDSYIFFGVLHNLALSSVLALPFVFCPPLVTAGVALLFVAMPFVVGGGVFDWPPLAFLGLASAAPITNDWVPVFPWTGFVLFGVVLGPLTADRLPRGRGGRVGRALGFLGRHSLLIYLLHQPVIFGALWAVQQTVGPSPAAETSAFLRSCVSSCRDLRQPDALCRRSCGCTMDRLKEDGLWPEMRSGRPGPEVLRQASARAQECLRAGS